jgi:S-adenosylmethionine-dependent methyltransferase
MRQVSLFSAGEAKWIERLDNLRNVVRQEVISRQLAPYVDPGVSVLDVGCGQGTQALRLASLGCSVTGVDPSRDLLDRFAAAATAAGIGVELIEGGIDALDHLLGDRRFDVVCAHGLLMYLDDRATAIASLASRLRPRGRLSLTFRNGHALAMRPGLRRDWVGAIESFDADAYVNELGVPATADRLEAVGRDLAAVGLRIVEWFGVRVFNDGVAAETTIPRDEDLALLFEAEDRAGRRDPYRWLGSQLHVIAEVVAEVIAEPASGLDAEATPTA